VYQPFYGATGNATFTLAAADDVPDFILPPT